MSNQHGITLYIASKAIHGPHWKELRSSGLPIIATWIDESGIGETKCFTDLWNRCVSEAAAADALIVYREKDEILKGAFVEVGCALNAGKPVIAVGCEGLGFTNHPLVTCVPSLEDAIQVAMSVHPTRTDASPIAVEFERILDEYDDELAPSTRDALERRIGALITLAAKHKQQDLANDEVERVARALCLDKVEFNRKIMNSHNLGPEETQKAVDRDWKDFAHLARTALQAAYSTQPSMNVLDKGVDRGSIIDGMCMTWRHDFGLDKDESSPLSSGMTDTERDGLRRSMGQVFDHNVAPLLALPETMAQEDEQLISRLKQAAHGPTAVGNPVVPRQLLTDAVNALTSKAKRITALEDRLEISGATNGKGERVAFMAHWPDGIANRDETIRQLDERFASLRQAKEGQDQELDNLREWKESILGLCTAIGLENFPWGGDKSGWGCVFEFIKWQYRRAEAAEDRLFVSQKALELAQSYIVHRAARGNQGFNAVLNAIEIALNPSTGEHPEERPAQSQAGSIGQSVSVNEAQIDAVLKRLLAQARLKDLRDGIRNEVSGALNSTTEPFETVTGTTERIFDMASAVMAEAVAEQREADAKIAEGLKIVFIPPDGTSINTATGQAVAAAIRCGKPFNS